MKEKGLLLILFLLSIPHISWNTTSNTDFGNELVVIKKTNETSFDNYAHSFYENLNEENLNFEAFKIGLRGFLKLQKSNSLKNNRYLTIIDFAKHSKEQRLFIIDIANQEIEHRSVVAHGRNSGFEFAKNFSNKPNSHKSSIGFYETAETYFGKHGYSLRLDGLEYSNSNARRRAIVIHSADYASEKFVKNNGRLGRSYGCPSLPKEGYKEVISKIKEGSCLFIYYPQKEYLNKSKLANPSINLQQNI